MGEEYKRRSSDSGMVTLYQGIIKILVIVLWAIMTTGVGYLFTKVLAHDTQLAILQDQVARDEEVLKTLDQHDRAYQTQLAEMGRRIDRVERHR